MIRFLLVLILSLVAAPALAADAAAPAANGIVGILVANLGPALATLVAAAASWAILQLAGWLRTKTSAEWARSLEDRLGIAAANAVRAVEQSLRPRMAAASADGKITEQEAAELREAALVAVKNQLGSAWDDLVRLAGGEDRAVGKVTTALEAELHGMRMARPAKRCGCGAELATVVVPRDGVLREILRCTKCGREPLAGLLAQKANFAAAPEVAGAPAPDPAQETAPTIPAAAGAVALLAAVLALPLMSGCAALRANTHDLTCGVEGSCVVCSGDLVQDGVTRAVEVRYCEDAAGTPAPAAAITAGD